MSSSLLLLLAPLVTLDAGASSLELQYSVRVRGHRVGQAKITVGSPKMRAGARLRRVVFEADVRPVGISVLRFAGKATSWTRKGWTPVDANWDWQEMATRTRVEASWKNGRIDAKYLRDGRLRKRIRSKTEGPWSDVISIFPWLMDQKMKPGNVLKTTTFTGNQIYKVSAVVQKPESIALPSGRTKAYPLAFTAIRPGKTRKCTRGIEARSKTPCKIQFDYELLGAVDAVLTRKRRRK